MFLYRRILVEKEHELISPEKNCFLQSNIRQSVNCVEYDRTRRGFFERRAIFMTLFLCLVFNTLISGQSISNVGTSAASFLEMGVGARAAGLGEAVVSLDQSATAMYWNSAGIGRVTGFQVNFSYIDWFIDTRYIYTGIVAPIPGKGAIGLNVISFGMDEQPVRLVGQEEGTGEFYSAQDIALGVTLAINLTNRFTFGINGKYIRQQIWHTSATGFALDLGALYITQWDGLRLGVSVSNFGSSLKLNGRDLINVLDPDISNYGVDNINVFYQTDAFDLPLIARLGMSYSHSLFSNKSQITIASDFLHPSNDSESINMGMEIVFLKTISIRTGYKSLFLRDIVSGISLGAGLVTGKIGGGKVTIDYAYVDWGVLNAVHNLSLGLKL